MKKTLFLAVLAGAALAGCVKNEEVAMSSDTSPERITFDAPVVGVPTRAEEIVGNYPTDRDFAVYALYHKDAFTNGTFANATSSIYMSDVTCNHTVEASESKEYWAPAADYYWPKQGYLTFAAYAPSKEIQVDDMAVAGGKRKLWPEGATVNWDKTGFTFTNFKVNDDPAKQIDLLYTERQYDKQNNTTGVVTNDPYDGVTLLFKHALSSIVFKAKTVENLTNTTIRITHIEVMNVVSTGTFAQNLTDNISGDSDEDKPAWTPIPGEGNANVKSYIVRESKFSKDNLDDGVVLTNESKFVIGEINELGAGKQRSDFILIPQNLDDADRKVSVLIKYTIQNGTQDPVQQEKAFQLAVKGDGVATYVWEMGKRYTYSIEIGLDKIYFNPTVDSWSTAIGTGIENDESTTI